MNVKRLFEISIIKTIWFNFHSEVMKIKPYSFDNTYLE